MRCLICSNDRDHFARDAAREAVAICVLCGAGVCQAHIQRYDVTTYSLQPGGMVPIRRPDPRPLRVYLCLQCADLVRGDAMTDRSQGDGHRASWVEWLADRARQLERIRGAGRPVPELAVAQ